MSTNLTDKEILTDMLMSLKQLNNMYNLLLQEASNENIFEATDSLNLEVLDCCREIFNLMNSKGWYKVEVDDAKKVSQARQQFEKERPSIN